MNRREKIQRLVELLFDQQLMESVQKIPGGDPEEEKASFEAGKARKKALMCGLQETAITEEDLDALLNVEGPVRRLLEILGSPDFLDRLGYKEAANG